MEGVCVTAAEAAVQADSRSGGNPGNRRCSVLDSRLRGNDTLGLARQGNGRLLHSANLMYLPEPAPTRCRGYESARTPQIVVIRPGRYSQTKKLRVRKTTLGPFSGLWSEVPVYYFP